MNNTFQNINKLSSLLEIAMLIAKQLTKHELKIFENLLRCSSTYLEVTAIMQYYLLNKEE